jgi:malonyl-CoA O-methyltransferase
VTDTITRQPSDVAAAYDVWANTYDTAPNETRELAGRVLRESGLTLSGARVIEVGCGTGRNTHWLADSARSVLALDISEGMLEKARSRVTAPSVRFLQHDITSAWPASSGSADVVIAMLVLEHVEQLGPVLSEAARVLGPNGELWLCELHPTRQMLGVGARFTHPETRELEHVTAFPHDVSDYVNGGILAGLTLLHLGEWRDAGTAYAAPPRLLSAHFRSRRPPSD